jgi:hypothetical protein
VGNCEIFYISGDQSYIQVVSFTKGPYKAVKDRRGNDKLDRSRLGRILEMT